MAYKWYKNGLKIDKMFFNILTNNSIEMMLSEPNFH